MKHLPRAKFSLLADRLFSAFSFRDDDVPLGSELSLEFDGQPVDVRVANGNVQGLSIRVDGCERSSCGNIATVGLESVGEAPGDRTRYVVRLAGSVAGSVAGTVAGSGGASPCVRASSRAVTWISLQATGRPATCRSTLEVAPSRRLRASRQKAFGCRPGVARSAQRR